MKKSERHELIRILIKKEKLGTQKQIQDSLETLGIFVTQTTLSRDLHEIGLTKVKKNGEMYYVLARETGQLNLIDFLSKHTQNVARAEFSLVFHTDLGEAAVLANVIDSNVDERILGTIAGADTLLVICRNQTAASEIEKQMAEFI